MLNSCNDLLAILAMSVKSNFTKNSSQQSDLHLPHLLMNHVGFNVLARYVALPALRECDEYLVGSRFSFRTNFLVRWLEWVGGSGPLANLSESGFLSLNRILFLILKF